MRFGTRCISIVLIAVGLPIGLFGAPPGRGESAAQAESAQETIACRVVESKTAPALGVEIVIFHHAELASRQQLGAFLEGHDGASVEFQTAGGDWQPATVFRLKSCFGRGLLTFPSARARLARGQTFLMRAVGPNENSTLQEPSTSVRVLPAAFFRQASSGSANESTESVPQHYTLTAAQRARAEAYSQVRHVVYFAGTLVAIAIYLILWLSGFGVALRNLARSVSCRLIVKCLIFAPLFVVATSLLSLPLDYYSDYRLEHRFDLSTQTLASWFGDWGKSLGLSILAGIVLMWVFYGVIRRGPRRWWFYFWLATIPLELFVMFIEPWAVEPLFYKFTPLAQTQPALTEHIEDMMDHAGLLIPRSRIFEMNASAKTKALNAYVSGLGSSKRVVVWDTTLAALTPDETLLVLGHETGHYVLHHIPKEFALIELVLLGLFYLGYRALKALLRRFGSRTGLEGEGDLASLPVAMLVLTLLSFMGSPLFNAISRHYEHQADQYGLEVAYGVVQDPNAAAARAEEALGVIDLADPDPSPFIVFWLYSHPPTEDRIRFENTYRPWAEGKPMEFVHPKL